MARFVLLALLFLSRPAPTLANYLTEAFDIGRYHCAVDPNVQIGDQPVDSPRDCQVTPEASGLGSLPVSNPIPETGIASVDQTENPAGEVDSGSNYYTVKPADTLVEIARENNLSVDVLLLANAEIVNPDLIYPDQKLLIPSAAEVERLRSEEERRREEEQQRIVASVPHGNGHWVDVDLGYQTVRAYEGDTLVKTFLVSTGTSRHPTVTGQFHIWIKFRFDDMRGPGYDLKNVPYVMYFYRDYGLHGTYWHHNFGTPMSHGCVNLRTEDAAWLYDFTSVGTLVNVH